MIAQLRGRLVARFATRAPAEVVVDVGGVGYLVQVPAGLALPAVGEPVELHTSLQVREDSMTLYGFANWEARQLFELLLTTSGVGPKLALAVLSTLSPDALTRAVADGDADAFTLVPGVGRKLAQRLLLELNDKLGATEPALAPAGNGHNSSLGEVRLALLELGYSPAEAQRAIEPLDPRDEVGELLRAALRSLAGG